MHKSMSDEMASADCLMCEMHAILRVRSGEIRQELQAMNPITEPNYEGLYGVLIDVDTDLRMLKERADA